MNIFVKLWGVFALLMASGVITAIIEIRVGSPEFVWPIPAVIVVAGWFFHKTAKELKKAGMST